jgi:plastocyanin
MIAFRPAAAWRIAVAAGLGLAAVALVPACAADAALVKIQNFAFTPQNLTVKAGTAVTFQNEDDIPHLVVANDHAFRSKALDTNDKYTFTFSKPGDFPYFCGLHPHMTGKIVVTP